MDLAGSERAAKTEASAEQLKVKNLNVKEDKSILEKEFELYGK